MNIDKLTIPWLGISLSPVVVSTSLGKVNSPLSLVLNTASSKESTVYQPSAKLFVPDPMLLLSSSLVLQKKKELSTYEAFRNPWPPRELRSLR